jgi:hypothetical protein
MNQGKSRRPMTTDQKRGLVILAFIMGLVAVVVLGVVWVALSLGLPVWIAVILAIVLAAGLGLFMFLNMS